MNTASVGVSRGLDLHKQDYMHSLAPADPAVVEAAMGLPQNSASVGPTTTLGTQAQSLAIPTGAGILPPPMDITNSLVPKRKKIGLGHWPNEMQSAGGSKTTVHCPMHKDAMMQPKSGKKLSKEAKVAFAMGA